MSTENDKIDVIRAARNGGTVVLQVVGRGSFKTAPRMKAFIQQQVVEMPGLHAIFDMKDCVSMDSTFMGVLAGVAMKIKKAGAGHTSVIHLTPKTFALLDTLGVCRLLEAFETENTPAELSETVKATVNFTALSEGSDRLASVETMLDAHEDLVRVSPDNRERFQDVISYLSKDVEDLKSSNEE